MPPHSSERSLRAMPHPHRMPNINPASDKANDTNPMMPIGGRMDAKLQTPRKANETPTAKPRRTGLSIWTYGRTRIPWPVTTKFLFGAKNISTLCARS